MITRKYSALVVDDHQIVLHGICSLLAASSDNALIVQALSGEEALKEASQQKFDIFILDVELRDISGFELLRRLQAMTPDAAFVFHTMHEEIWILKQMMTSGADAVVLKGDNIQDLLTAVAAVLDGDSFYSRRVEKYCREYETDVMPSQREIEILKEIARGSSSGEIGERLFISTNTVEFHRKRLFRKLNASNMAELISKAYERGLRLI